MHDARQVNAVTNHAQKNNHRQSNNNNKSNKIGGGEKERDGFTIATGLCFEERKTRSPVTEPHHERASQRGVVIVIIFAVVKVAAVALGRMLMAVSETKMR